MAGHSVQRVWCFWAGRVVRKNKMEGKELDAVVGGEEGNVLEQGMLPKLKKRPGEREWQGSEPIEWN